MPTRLQWLEAAWVKPGWISHNLVDTISANDTWDIRESIPDWTGKNSYDGDKGADAVPSQEWYGLRYPT